MGTGLVTGYGFGHVIAQVQGQGPEAVHLELGGIFSAEGVDLSPELGESHCYTSSRKCVWRWEMRGGRGFSLPRERRVGCGNDGLGAGKIGWEIARERRRISRFRSFPDKSGASGPAGWPGAESGKLRRSWERVALLVFLFIERYVASVAVLNGSGP